LLSGSVEGCEHTDSGVAVTLALGLRAAIAQERFEAVGKSAAGSRST